MTQCFHVSYRVGDENFAELFEHVSALMLSDIILSSAVIERMHDAQSHLNIFVKLIQNNMMAAVSKFGHSFSVTNLS